jgi:7,8-dihydropterin-6-yl-methyl-4-(beta-D-ribofuranosyl)aminobenzene 5'-phosphate synthase
LDTEEGLLIVTGCSHPGIVAIAKEAKEKLKRNIHTILGGTHLLRHSENELRIVIDELKALGVRNVAATHCSGDKTIALFKETLGDGFAKMGVGQIIEFKKK